MILWSGQNVYDSSALHENGFDWTSNCKKDHKGGSTVKSCCGFYPDRFTHSEARKCCENTQQLFNPVHSECCGNDGVHSIGVC